MMQYGFLNVLYIYGNLQISAALSLSVQYYIRCTLNESIL